ncbi:DUF4369 domain-containing protein [Marinifilum caeruleilacunae]|uniref:DUF4369 domain-containing protein n=1 Tax=Marinifilum caeruleilacunae TaxID=2499076 RepID=A0ABX1WX82_9BACT|nr:DUF4369 domain-containing protein [Marinifilum caeruleilacunae]NOU60470.1 DUF4369 domain-containing protein [Marinifilum caeruleilacunae]
MNKVIWTLFLSILFAIPSNAQKSFTLKGMIGGLQEEYIYLYKLNGETQEFIDSVKTKNGEFKFEAACDQAFAAQISVAGRKSGKIFISPTTMNLFVHKKDMNYKFLIGKLKGSPAQDRYEDYQAKLAENNKQKLKVAENLEIPEVQSDPVKKDQFMKEYRRLNKFKDDYYYKYASSPVIPYLIYQEYFAAKRNLDYVRKQLEILKLANPNGMYVNNLQKRVEVIETLQNKGQFPEIDAPTLTGEKYTLSKQRGKPILLYFWRAWRQDQNQKFYDEIKNVTSSFPSLEVVSIIRNSSYNKMRIPGTKKLIAWHPEARHELNCIEIESLDKSVDVVRYMDRGFHAYLLDKNGKILYYQDEMNLEMLKSQVSTYLSKQ